MDRTLKRKIIENLIEKCYLKYDFLRDKNLDQLKQKSLNKFLDKDISTDEMCNTLGKLFFEKKEKFNREKNEADMMFSENVSKNESVEEKGKTYVMNNYNTNHFRNFNNRGFVMKRFLIVTCIIFCVVLGIILALKINTDDIDKVIEVPCASIDGGSFDVYYYVDGKNIKIESVCIACSPSSYNKLLVPKKDKKKFDGWYYDEKFKEKVDGDSTLNINPEPKYDRDCIIGYKDIKLYAKWK